MSYCTLAKAGSESRVLRKGCFIMDPSPALHRRNCSTVTALRKSSRNTQIYHSNEICSKYLNFRPWKPGNENPEPMMAIRQQA